MGDPMIHLEYGALPWEPTPESSLKEVLDYWDMPTIGLIAQDGQQYLFWCETGINDDLSVWGYVRVEDDDVEQLLGASDFDSTFADIIAGRRKLVAMHTEDAGIVAVAEVEPPNKDLVGAFGAAMRMMEEALNRIHDSIRDSSRREAV
ncbi:MAG: hypothetical protein ABR592_01960 [Nitriliruptorales bacterium]